jgi:hypothetical protein
VAIGDTGGIADELNESAIILSILQSQHIHGTS